MTDWLLQTLSASRVADFESMLETWGGLAFLGLFGLEMLRLALRKRLSWRMLGDSAASFLTFGFFIVFTYGLIAAAYVSVFYWVYLNFAFVEIPVTPLSVAALLILCDFAYYWEHRFTHRVGMAWATHSVHHSSPHFNISVAYRFGPMDGVWPLLFHLPLALVGFDPIVIFACEAFVQLFQTALHTETIGKLPRWIEATFNTPSHHRVHHGSNPEYLDKNYGGIFIIWDRLFGTYAEEEAPVNFGLTQQIESNNPLTVYFHGFARLVRRSWQSASLGDALYAWVAPPDWSPGQARQAQQGWLIPASMVLVVTLWTGSTPGIAEDRPETAPAAESEQATGEPVDTALAEKLRASAEYYYGHAINARMDQAYAVFAEDALFHYRMDFGSYYGTSEYSFRANDPAGFDDGLFDGYQSSGAQFTITGIRVAETGGIVEATFTESYVWDGYEGQLEAKERLYFDVTDGEAVVRRFDSEQVYR